MSAAYHYPTDVTDRPEILARQHTGGFCLPPSACPGHVTSCCTSLRRGPQHP
jgi:hypothetical protein